MVSRYFSLFREHSLVLTFGFVTVFWGNFGQSFFVGVFGEAIQESLQLSATAYGNAYSLATVLSALTVTWLGGLIDHMKLRNYALLVAAGLFAAMLAMSQASSVLLLMLAFYLLRLFGQALLPHTGITSMARAFQANRGLAVSLATSGVPVGEIILPGLAVTLIAWIGWQHTFLLFSASVPLLLVPLILLCVERGFARTEQGGDMRTAPQRSQKSSGARRRLLQDYRFWLVLPGYMAGPFIVTGIFVHQNFVAASKGWTLAWFATAFVVYGLVHWVSSLLAGVLVDRFRASSLLPFYPLPMTGALLVLAFVPGDWVAIPVMALLALSIGSSPPISNSLWPEIYGSDNLGAIRSLTVALMVFATALSPVLFGALIDRGSELGAIMAACAAFVLLGCVLMTLSYPLQHFRRGI